MVAIACVVYIVLVVNSVGIEVEDPLVVPVVASVAVASSSLGL